MLLSRPLILLLLLALMTVPSRADVAMVMSIQRHGARDVLKKSAFLQESDAFGGPSLLPIGQRLCYQAGQDYTARYINASTCATGGAGKDTVSTCILQWNASGNFGGVNYGLLNETGNGYNSYNVLFSSSALDRTLQSAQSFLAGIFPALPPSVRNNTASYLPSNQQVIPVYTVKDDNDNTIRAYTKCPTYDNRLEAWYTSDEFYAMSNASQGLRDQIHDLYPSFDTSLENWWNVYDPFNIWATYGVGDNLTLPPSTNGYPSLFQNMTALAYWAEVSKMRSNMTGSLLGGTMLALLHGWLTAASDTLLAAANTPPGTSDLSLYQLLGYSAHYNTQLGVLGALKLDTHPPAVAALTFSGRSWLATGALPNPPGVTAKLPGLASVVAFELHVPSSAAGTTGVGSELDLAVRLAVQDAHGSVLAISPSTSSYVAVPMPCSTNQSDALGGPAACPLVDFLAYIEPLMLDVNNSWCEACQNTAVDACVAYALGVELNNTIGCGSCSGGHAAWEIAVGVVVTFVGTLLVCAMLGWLWARRAARHASAAAAAAKADTVMIEM